MGVSFSNSLAVMVPIWVLKMAYKPSSSCGAAAGAAGVVDGGAWANAQTATQITVDNRFIRILRLQAILYGTATAEETGPV
jgi:hypothetical protein